MTAMMLNVSTIPQPSNATPPRRQDRDAATLLVQVVVCKTALRSGPRPALSRVDHRKSERIEEGQKTDSALRSLGRGVPSLALALLTRADHLLSHAVPCRAAQE